MEYQMPESACLLCKSKFKTRGMGRHITACLKKQSVKTKIESPKRRYYFSVRDAYNNDYFLFLLASQNSTLKDLDIFLRKIWLECCGHMSAFSWQKRGGDIPKKTKIKTIFSIGSILTYVYDFGSSTELSVKFLGTFDGALKNREKIVILSRNARPEIPCDECGDFPAVHICGECQWEGDNWLCKKCGADHECGDEMFLPAPNSPRAGVCGYTGGMGGKYPLPEIL